MNFSNSTTLCLRKRRYLVQELVLGIELFDYILRLQEHTEEKARSLIEKILSALEYLHRQGIAHRDIKPENILVTNMSFTEIAIDPTFFHNHQRLPQIITLN